ncbi:MAG: hypothetical protein HY677_06790 [Chloroflexi bacterium]|nr:hypothetical protein [Chloroflexota bacterium]
MRLPRVPAVVGLLLVALLLACSRQSDDEVRTSTDVPVTASYIVTRPPSYSKDIQPLFDRYCVKCHGAKRAEKGLRLDSYQHTMAGSKYGTVIIPYSSAVSLLLGGLERDIMPPGKAKLLPNEIKNVMFWIDGGAPDN